MGESAERYRRIADQFTARVDAVPDDAWDRPAPCEGWVARDVVRHLVEWVPGFFGTYAGIRFPDLPSVDTDPRAAWAGLDAALRALLDDPEVAAKQFDAPPGPTTVEDAVLAFCAGDVLVHTWDLARATGLDERLDPDEVHRALVGMEPLDEVLRQSGHYGPRVAVPDDADEQTRLIAFTGRRP
jgi:uncharacterized protein (TIGR03086 family)